MLPGYEASFVGRQPLSFLGDLPPHLVSALEEAGLTTLGQVSEADEATLAAVVGPAAAARLRATAGGQGEDPIPVTAPPAWVQEEATIRDRRSDGAALRDVFDGLARRAARRLRPFDLGAEQVAVEVRRPEGNARRSESLGEEVSDDEAIAEAVRGLAEPLIEPATRVRTVAVRLSRLHAKGAQTPLFPGFAHASVARRSS